MKKILSVFKEKKEKEFNLKPILYISAIIALISSLLISTTLIRSEHKKTILLLENKFASTEGSIKLFLKTPQII